MNLIEAMKSGKPFRRKGRPTHTPWHLSELANKKQRQFTVADILADDWEVEEKKVEVTANQVYECYFRVLGKDSPLFSSKNFIEQLIKELGLE